MISLDLLPWYEVWRYQNEPLILFFFHDSQALQLFWLWYLLFKNLDCDEKCGLEVDIGPCKEYCDEINTTTEDPNHTLEGSDIVNAVMEESINMNIAVYIIMMFLTIILVSYAVYLSYQIVTKGSQRNLSTVNLTHDYQPVPVSQDQELQ